ncbi:ArpU family phage packaging/lysis transcriptional regulator [Paenibacillus sp. GCM10012303]|uniref:ArpU family phage packaging/lysis transcriptional regulator n=1 Tax=Paenibacillus sp. GCM10012303 TaxID=3317340 RepID=UPI00362064F5
MRMGNDFIPDLDPKKVRKEVEKVFFIYRTYKYLGFEEREASTTASYEDRQGGNTNVTSDQTASVAIQNVDQKEYRRSYCERVELAVKGLPRMERFLIIERYTTEETEYITDQNVYNHKFNPPISENKYTKIRGKAFLRLVLKFDDLKLLQLADLAKKGE